MAKYLVEQGRVVGCWIFIFSARRGPLLHGRTRVDGSTAHTARSIIFVHQEKPIVPSINPRATWRANKKRSRMTGSGSLRLQISLLAAERTVVLHRAGMQVDNLCDKMQHSQIILY
jgi:hypothetical protein